MKQEEKYELVRLDPDIPVFMWLHTRGKTRNPRVVDYHWHRSLEFNIIWKDDLMYYRNGMEYRLAPGGVCLINSMDVHRMEFRSEVVSREVTAFTLIIGYEFLRRLVPDFEECFFELEGVEQTKAVYALLREIAGIYGRQESTYWKAAVMEKVCGLIFYMCSNCRKNRNMIPLHAQTGVREVRAMIEYIQEHYTQEIRQKELSETFFYSREYMSKLFRRYTKCTVKEYLTQYRLLQSEKLLLHTDKSVTEIAMTAGFGDAKQMIRAFHRYYGITPLQFRKTGQWKP